MDTAYLKARKKECLRTLLDLYKKAGAGHIGSSLSCFDIMVYLFYHRMKPEDKFILSKGHAAAALYTLCAETGRMPRTELDTFYKDGTFLSAHPPCRPNTNGILMGTGSLGHGLSLASGIALAGRFTKQHFNVYCLISDGDCNCGSTWEAALFAAHHSLDNLHVIIDNNGLQGFGRTDEVLGMGSLVDKWNSFGFFTRQTDCGNDFECLDRAFSLMDKSGSHAPKCIIAKTIKGKGISFMENKLEWHYLPFTDALYKQALRELEIDNA